MPSTSSSGAGSEHNDHEITFEHIEFAELAMDDDNASIEPTLAASNEHTARRSYGRRALSTQTPALRRNSRRSANRRNNSAELHQDQGTAQASLRSIQAQHTTDVSQSSWYNIFDSIWRLFGADTSQTPTQSVPAGETSGNSRSSSRNSVPYTWSLVDLPEPAARVIREALGAHPDHQSLYIEFFEGIELEFEDSDRQSGTWH